MNIHTGDSVVVITGKDKGKVGTILRLLPSTNRVVVAGVNLRTRHMRRSAQSAGQVVKYEASIHRSNVMIVDPKTKKPTRIGYRVNADGQKVRIARRSGEELKRVSTAVAKPEAAVKQAAATKAKNPQATKKKKSAEPSAVTVEAGKKPQAKGPFWKKFLGGSTASIDTDTAEGPVKSSDHSVPEESRASRSRAASRGS